MTVIDDFISSLISNNQERVLKYNLFIKTRDIKINKELFYKKLFIADSCFDVSMYYINEKFFNQYLKDKYKLEF